MDSPPTPTPRFRVTIRGLLIVNVYSAVVLTGVVVLAHTSRDFRTPALLIASCAIPEGLLVVSALVIRPGPGRDFLIYVFGALTALIAVVWLTAGFLIIVPRALSSRPSFAWPFVGFLALLNMVFWFGFVAIARACVPARCPVCQRRAQITAGLNKPVPSTDYEFFWCVACKSRCKRSKSNPADWTDASDAEDDRFYFLATPISWIRGLLKRRPSAGGPHEG